MRKVYDERGSLPLDPESLRLLEITYDGFVKSGALLSELDKETLKRLVVAERARLESMLFDLSLNASDRDRLQAEVERLGVLYRKIEKAA